MRITNTALLKKLVSRGQIREDISDVLHANSQGNGSSPQRENKAERQLESLLIQEFGDWHQGGEVVPELMAVPHRRYRLDFALPRHRIGIELDGYTDHTSLKGFQRDREKDLLLSLEQWHIIRVTPSLVCQQSGKLTRLIHMLRNQRPEFPAAITLTPGGYCKFDDCQTGETN